MSEELHGEPGTGTEYYVEATMDPRRDPTFDVEEEREVREAQRWHHCGRTWVCGRDYLDVVSRDVAMLTAVVRKSVWCSTKEPKESPIFLQFELERGEQLEYQIEDGNWETTASERFLERYRPPVNRGP